MANDVEKKRQELLKAASDRLPDPVHTIAFLEHQMDLMGRIILDLADNATGLTEEQLERVLMLQELIDYSSVDFNNLKHPLQSYKIPKAVEQKAYTRLIQDRYLKAQQREGIF